MRQKIAIIGGGVGGLAVACLLAKAGNKVTVFEKNDQLGGRAGLLTAQSFRFDTGPSWYLMSGVFEHFFELLGEPVRDHFTLTKLSPSFRVFDDGSGRRIDITSNVAKDAATFEAIEPGAGEQLKKYLNRAAQTYATAFDEFMYATPTRKRELLSTKLAKTQLLTSMHRDAARYFKTPLLQKIIEYPAVFLGTSPYKAPALYGLLNHCLLSDGVFYPAGGIYQLVEALVRIGRKHGVTYKTNAPVSEILVEDGRAAGVAVNGRRVPADIVISDAGKYHTEVALLAPAHRDHSPGYWQRRGWSPSALLLYLGVNRQYAALAHHNLFFSKNWRQNFTEIFGHDNFPANPSLYVCTPSKTDPSTAPKAHENLFVLVPVSAGLRYTPKQLTDFSQRVLTLLEDKLGLDDLREHIVYQKTFCVDDFAGQLNSYLGNGLGLQHTLRQSALFRPSNTSKKVQGLYYVGADVHPGIGLPPVLISAELLFNRLTKQD